MTGGSAGKTDRGTHRVAGADPLTEFSLLANSGLESACYERSRSRDLGGKMLRAHGVETRDGTR